jgi:hypothetical protein
VTGTGVNRSALLQMMKARSVVEGNDIRSPSGSISPSQVRTVMTHSPAAITPNSI